MKLGEALTELKREQNKLSRLILLRKDHIYREEGTPTKFDPQHLSTEINKKVNEIRDLKLRIQHTNIATKISGEKITLAEAIIKMSDVRNEIKNLTGLFERRNEYLFREKDERKRITAIDERIVEKEIEKLENERTQLDNKIQVTNWTTLLQV